MSMLLACLFVAAYLLGAVPFGVLITRAKGVDIRKVGSGNIGATNVARALGKGWAVVVFLLDLMKGFAPTYLARFVIGDGHWIGYMIGLAAIAGHCASPFLGFRGGKGIATSLGMVFGASPVVAASGFGVFLVLFAATRYVSLSSIIAVGSSVVAGAILRDWTYVGIGSILFLFVLYTHRANIKRLRDGTEPKFNFGKKEDRDENDEDGGAAKAVPMATGPGPLKGTIAQTPPAGDA